MLTLIDHTLRQIKALIEQSRPQQAIDLADHLLSTATSDHDSRLADVYLLRGHAFRQLGNWQMAINNYLAAKQLQPDGPAEQALAAAQEILSFYHHDLYNP